jgi:hypothetical protein
MCVYICVCAKYSDFLCIWLRKCGLFNREVRYQIHSGSGFAGSGFAGSGSEMIYSPPDLNPDPAKSSGSDRIRIHNTK